MGAAKILLIEDDESYANSVRTMLMQHPVEIVWAPTGAQGIQLYRKSTLSFATVIVDYLLPDYRGSEVAQQIRRINPVQDILFASGFSKPEYLTDMLVAGCARTFIVKGQPVEDTRDTILSSIRLFERKNRVLDVADHPPDRIESLAKQFGLVGRSRETYTLIEQAQKYCAAGVDVRITGETGVGKEVIANALTPKDKKLIVVDCTQFKDSENTFESEMFGHVKGAFTGADAEKAGYLLQAHQQVLFLDEVHTLSLTAQAKFLRVIQERKFKKKGDNRANFMSVDFTLISAAKPEIHEMVKRNEFLPDLHCRLGMVDIRIPALRERPDDIEPLVLHFQEQFNQKHFPTNPVRFRAATIREMERYSWPTNIRQLQKAVCSMMLNARGNIVDPADFQNFLATTPDGKLSGSIAEGSIQESTDAREVEQIVAALKASRHQSEAAERLGIDRFKLLRKMKRLGIDPKAYLMSQK